jgi:hypothetical protein
MRWAGHVTRWGRREASIGFWWVNLRERDRCTGRLRHRWEDIIRIIRKWDVGVWTGLGWLRIETGGEKL